ncbi:MSL complex subunit 2 [Rhinolophus ferrumequinum]|uniref:MSL complex subunit 2 n=1 Tax=Rhinolophus ferrumequinum TaxID=59479 RepID=A0A7J7UJU1_RHIFE|nr:MSL complex subunit 2 [Rhinolophus ferrumequinum]
MNPVNATALYISASRLVLNYDPGDPKAFTEINRLLPYFRQSLSCCVCGGCWYNVMHPQLENSVRNFPPCSSTNALTDICYKILLHPPTPPANTMSAKLVKARK